MAVTYQDFIQIAQNSEVMTNIPPERVKAILESYKNATPEQLEDGINEIKKHDVQWAKTKEEDQKALAAAEKNLNEAMEGAPKRHMDNMHKKEDASRKSEESILASLEDELNNLN